MENLSLNFVPDAAQLLAEIQHLISRARQTLNLSRRLMGLWHKVQGDGLQLLRWLLSSPACQLMRLCLKSISSPDSNGQAADRLFDLRRLKFLHQAVGPVDLVKSFENSR